MLISYLRKLLTTSADRTSRARFAVWFSLSLLVGLALYLYKVSSDFNAEYIVQDDARQWVFWMSRFSDRSLFPGDLIADYYQSVVPLGYTALFWLGNALFFDPLTLAKILPVILGLIVTAYSFAVCLQILPVPSAAFFVTLTLNQCLSMRDDLVSATPRAFFYPLFLASLFYLLRRSLLPFLISVAMLGLFYPQGALLTAGVLPFTLLRYEGGRLRLPRDRREYAICAAGIAMILATLSLHAWKSGGWGQIVTAGQAQTMHEYSSEGRLPLFYENRWDYWVKGQLGGMMPGRLPPLAWAGVLLPLLSLWRPKQPLTEKMTGAANILPQVAIGSVVMFFLAHLLLVRLHFPSRYTQHSLRIVISFAAGLSIALLIDAILGVAERLPRVPESIRQGLTLGTILLLASVVVTRVPLNKVARGRHVKSEEGGLFRFLSTQPKDTIIASLSPVGDNIPTFTKRTILVAREYALPVHTGYYARMRQRAVDLIAAHYSPDPERLRSFIRQYRVDFFVVDRSAFTQEYVVENSFIRIYPEASDEALKTIERGTVPTLQKVMDSCSVSESGGLVVVSADCILGMADERSRLSYRSSAQATLMISTSLASTGRGAASSKSKIPDRFMP